MHGPPVSTFLLVIAKTVSSGHGRESCVLHRSDTRDSIGPNALPRNPSFHVPCPSVQALSTRSTMCAHPAAACKQSTARQPLVMLLHIIHGQGLSTHEPASGARRTHLESCMCQGG